MKDVDSHDLYCLCRWSANKFPDTLIVLENQVGTCSGGKGEETSIQSKKNYYLRASPPI